MARDKKKSKKNKKKSSPWQDFKQHFGTYAVVIGTLAIINLFLTRGALWFIWPAMGWGIAVAIHFVTAVAEDYGGKLKDLLTHAGVMGVIILGLGLINLRTSPGNWWFLWPALFMAASVAIHFVSYLSEQSKSHEDEDEDEDVIYAHQEQTRQQESRSKAPVANNITNSKQSQLENETLQAYLNQAIVYQQKVTEMVEGTTNEQAKIRLQRLSDQINGWVTNIEDLVRRVDALQNNDLIKQDWQTVPKSIARLEEQLSSEIDPSLKQDIERTLNNRKNQLASLEQLKSMTQRAEIQMESTLSAMGTIYSQILTTQSTNQVADYTHLSDEAEEETRRLQDHLEALQEVKLGE
ncbi:MAG: 2TM domain-containing protein [Chloroflexota bacterium]